MVAVRGKSPQILPAMMIRTRLTAKGMNQRLPGLVWQSVSPCWSRFLILGLAGVLLASMGSGCSIRRMAVNQVGNALAAGGTTFAADDDPELVKAALPFSLKLMESLLAESPRHRGLLLATASGFTQFSFAFVQLEADVLEDRDVAAARAMRERARGLYLRARDYGLSGLAVRHRNFEARLRHDAQEALRSTRREDVPLLYWTAASWAAAVAVLKDDPDLIADLGLVEALIDRALLLQEDYADGAIHGFLISFAMARQVSPAEQEARARQHFARAVELTAGQQAGPFVSLAEGVAILNQDVAEFRELLARALSIDPDGRVEWRLVNVILQERARWLLNRTEDLFLLSDEL
jgi:predicted anti-sigma-YlaC factor YlaD